MSRTTNVSQETIEFILAVVVVGLSLNLFASAFLQLMPKYALLTAILSIFTTLASCVLLAVIWKRRQKTISAVKKLVAGEIWVLLFHFTSDFHEKIPGYFESGILDVARQRRPPETKEKDYDKDLAKAKSTFLEMKLKDLSKLLEWFRGKFSELCAIAILYDGFVNPQVLESMSRVRVKLQRVANFIDKNLPLKAKGADMRLSEIDHFGLTSDELVDVFVEILVMERI